MCHKRGNPQGQARDGTARPLTCMAMVTTGDAGPVASIQLPLDRTMGLVVVTCLAGTPPATGTTRRLPG
jgi:hypothetical protein